MPLPADVKQLMRRTVTWERHTGQDVYADETYAAAIALTCQVEPEDQGRREILRKADGTEVVPKLRLYFDAADADVQLFGDRDRFTAPDIAGGEKLQPAQVNTLYGPDGDAWLVEVVL